MSTRYTPRTVGPVDHDLIAAAVAALEPHVGFRLLNPYKRGREAEITITTRGSRYRFADVRGVDSASVTLHGIASDDCLQWEQVEAVEIDGCEFPLRRRQPSKVAA